jgi:hypothetical protein
MGFANFENGDHFSAVKRIERSKGSQIPSLAVSIIPYESSAFVGSSVLAFLPFFVHDTLATMDTQMVAADSVYHLEFPLLDARSRHHSS